MKGAPAVANAASLSAVLDENTVIPIYAIQGSGLSSPLVGQHVTTAGVVTAVDSNGFYLQDPEGDGDEATSDGIFVFTGGAPAVQVGDESQVTGTVSEFFPGGSATGNLSVTQIGSPMVDVLSTGNDLPAALLLGPDGRLPPTRSLTEGIVFYESLEGMLVTVQAPTVVGPTNAFGEIYVAVRDQDGNLNATGLSDRGTLNIEGGRGGPAVTNTEGRRADFNPERIQIDDDSTLTPGSAPAVAVGAQLADVTGVVSYSFGNYEVLATTAITAAEESSLEPETSPLQAGADGLLIAAYNVLNLDPQVEASGQIDDDVGDGRFAAIAEHIAVNLNSPAIVALQEIQDNDGAEITDVIAADLTLQTLVEAIVAAGGPEYAFIDNPFIGNGTSGGQPGGNIRTAFLYDPDEVELVEGSVTTITDPAQQIAQTEAFGAWQAGLNPFVDARLPLVATFAAGGEEVTVVNNHFTSKGGSTPLLGAVQPPINGGEPQRVEQALAVNDFVADLLAEDRRANIVVAGDLNEFEFEEPLAALEFGNVRGRGRAELFNLTDELPRDERYSFIFEGNSQSLDHILVSRSLRREAEFDAVHVNSEFADVPERASDHDPLLARIELPGADWMLT